MKLVYIILATISLNVSGQPIDQIFLSPDKNFSLTFTAKEIGDANTEFKYWLRNGEDSTLLTTSILHDMPAPVAYWDKSSTRLIYEEQDSEEIRIYDLVAKRLIFQTNGFIWGHSMEYFDEISGTVLFFRESTPGQWGNFDLMTLNLESLEVRSIHSVKTSGDPYTGAPEILTLDKVKREIVLTFEADDNMNVRNEQLTVSY